MSVPTHEMSKREQLGYIITIGFDELHDQIEAGVNEEPQTWVSFMAECAIKLAGDVEANGSLIPRQRVIEHEA